MKKIEDKQCTKCGGNTHIKFVPSSGMDIQPTGMFRICNRCGYEESIKSLDDKSNICDASLEN